MRGQACFFARTGPARGRAGRAGFRMLSCGQKQNRTVASLKAARLRLCIRIADASRGGGPGVVPPALFAPAQSAIPRQACEENRSVSVGCRAEAFPLSARPCLTRKFSAEAGVNRLGFCGGLIFHENRLRETLCASPDFMKIDYCLCRHPGGGLENIYDEERKTRRTTRCGYSTGGADAVPSHGRKPRRRSPQNEQYRQG